MKPDVRIIQNQQTEINQSPQIDSWEAEQLMRKYGYKNPTNSPTDSHNPIETDEGLTFEEMIAREDAKIRNEKLQRTNKPNSQGPVSFDGRGGYYTETRYGSDEDSGYGFKVQVTSDMPITKY
jgi:hypothetical protein